MKMASSILVVRSALLVTLMWASASRAEDAIAAVEDQRATPTTPDVASSTSANELTDIVVTATKSQVNVQSAPVTITALTGAQLAQSGVTDVASLSQVTPAVTFTPIRSRAIVYIRGVGQGITSGNADPAVAINFNDAYLPPELSNLAFFDVDRVEVVYGPQGTLYGRNAVAGAINVVTNRPGKTFGIDTEVEVGNYGSFLYTGSLNAPITPDLSVRVAGERMRHDGYFSNGADNGDLSAGRLSAEYTPGSDTTVYFVVGFAYDGGLGDGGQNLPPAGNPWYLAYDPRAIPLYEQGDAVNSTLEITHRFASNLDFTYVGSYSQLNETTQFPAYLNVPGNLKYVHYELYPRTYTQEARLNGTVGPWTWIAGLYGYHSVTDELSYLRNQLLPTPVSDVGPVHQHAYGAAGFGQLTYAVSDVLRFTAGTRYSYDYKLFKGVNGVYLDTGAPPPMLTQNYSGSESKTRPDLKASVEYDAAAHSLLYGSFQTGYNTGGFSTSPIAAGSTQAAPFQPMTVDAYALGSKNRFLDNRFQANAELFYNDYQNYQVSYRSVQTGQAIVYNAHRATTYGVQFDLRANVTDEDEVGAGAALLRARFNELDLPVAPFNISGFQMPLAPVATVDADYTHHFPLTGGATIDFLGNYKYTSSQWGIYTHGAGSYIRPYSMADLSLNYLPAVRHWSAGAYVRNLTNTFTTGFTSANAIPGPGYGFPLPPRTYGLRFTAHY
jgi:iron complex outermembrane receptor protein